MQERINTYLHYAYYELHNFKLILGKVLKDGGIIQE